MGISRYRGLSSEADPGNEEGIRWQTRVFLGGNALTFAGLMCIRRFEARLVTRPDRRGRVAQGPARKNILGEAQTFADLMGISTYREERVPVGEPVVENGQTDSRMLKGSARGGRPFSRPRWPLVDIGRSLAKAQRLAQVGRLAGRRRISLLQGNYFHRGSRDGIGGGDG